MKPSIDKATPRPFSELLDAITLATANGNIQEHSFAMQAALDAYDRLQDIADERVREARKEVWDAAIVVAQSFSDHYMARSVTIALREAARAAEGEG